ncbi:MAG: CHAT domain-containing protein [Anaerolineae bacterium]|nr:CHAT domain-containing protein [Anaerolineae bacterium]MDH7473943.1 CHAT domain-containing protein [Anaerolineae bacterium]
MAERWRRGLPGFDFQLLQAADWGALYQDMMLCALRRKRYTEAWAYTERQKARAWREWLVQMDASPEVIQSELAAEGLSQFLPEEGTALVSFNVTHRGSVAFIMHRQGVESGEPPQDAGDWSPLPALTGPVGTPHLEVVTMPGFTRDDLEWMLITREREVGLRAVVSEDYLRIAEPLGRAVGGWLVDYYRFQNEQTDETCARWLVTLAETGRVLYEKLLRPVVERLDALGVQRLILVPSLGLHLLPLHAASPGDSGEHTLLDDYEISYAPAALVWRHCRERETKVCEGLLVAAANPTGDLPFAGYEVQSIRTQFPPGKSTTLWREEATQENVLARAGEAGYLHLACHGLFDLVDPLESQLSLADGDLTLRDVLGQLRLSDARLVVLSACETGVSEFRALADEVIGLPAGFLMAGATAVMASLWAVNDLSTALLMERFYHNLLAEQQRPSAALRAAQLWLRQVQAGELAARFEAERRRPNDERTMTYEQASTAWRRFVAMRPDAHPFAHPYYWAAFTLSGA